MLVSPGWLPVVYRRRRRSGRTGTAKQSRFVDPAYFQLESFDLRTASFLDGECHDARFRDADGKRKLSMVKWQPHLHDWHCYPQCQRHGYFDPIEPECRSIQCTLSSGRSVFGRRGASWQHIPRAGAASPAGTAARLTSSANPSIVGQPVTFTAQITSPTVTPTRPVTFSIGTTILETAQLSAGKAKFTTADLPAGTYSMKATYFGDSNIAKSSATLTQTVH